MAANRPDHATRTGRSGVQCSTSTDLRVDDQPGLTLKLGRHTANSQALCRPGYLSRSSRVGLASGSGNACALCAGDG